MFPSQYFELQHHIITDHNKSLQIKYIKHHFYHLSAQANNNRPVCYHKMFSHISTFCQSTLSLIQTQRYTFRLQAQAHKGARQLEQMIQ